MAERMCPVCKKRPVWRTHQSNDRTTTTRSLHGASPTDAPQVRSHA